MNAASMGGRGVRGFTLIELLIVAAVAALLLAVAVPMYSSYVTRGKRSEAKAVLLQMAQAMERSFTAFGSYNNSSGTFPLPAVAGACIAVAPVGSASPNYCVTGTTPANGATFVLSATPCGDASASCPAGSNTNYADPDCDVLTIDNTGVKSDTGSLAANPDQCWQR